MRTRVGVVRKGAGMVIHRKSVVSAIHVDHETDALDDERSTTQKHTCHLTLLEDNACETDLRAFRV
jgi:hypothetical protein